MNSSSTGARHRPRPALYTRRVWFSVVSHTSRCQKTREGLGDELIHWLNGGYCLKLGSELVRDSLKNFVGAVDI